MADVMTDAAEDPIDAIVRIGFEPEDEMRKALQDDSYRKATELRKAYMRESSVGTHSAVVERAVKLV